MYKTVWQECSGHFADIKIQVVKLRLNLISGTVIVLAYAFSTFSLWYLGISHSFL